MPKFLKFIQKILLFSLFKGMEFHEELHNLGAKEGLKGRKLNKATESFAWNITVLKVSEVLRCPFAFIFLFISLIGLLISGWKQWL